MNSELVQSVVVIALRQLAPLVGGVGLVSDDHLKQIAGAVVLIGSILYHAHKRHTGQQRRA